MKYYPCRAGDRVPVGWMPMAEKETLAGTMEFSRYDLPASCSVGRIIGRQGNSIHGLCPLSKARNEISDNDEKKSLSINLDGLCFGRSFGGTVWSMSYLLSPISVGRRLVFHDGGMV